MKKKVCSEAFFPQDIALNNSICITGSPVQVQWVEPLEKVGIKTTSTAKATQDFHIDFTAKTAISS